MRRKRWTLVAVTLALGITILDETVVFLALPAIDRDLGVGLAGQQWVVNGYLLPLAALLLLTGSLADRYGRRRLFILGLVGFGLASLAAGLAPSAGFLIVARVVQGVFAALLMPSTLSLLVATFRGEERAGAIEAWAAWSGAAAAIGPLVGGVLISAASWRWVFFLSLPVVAVAIGLALWAVEESREEQARTDRLDVLGALWATLAVGGAAYAVVQGPEAGWTAPAVLGAAAAALLALAAFLVRERRTESPMLPLDLFRIRNFSAANAATLALYAVFNGNFFLLTIYLQTTLDYTALAAGAATLPLTLLMLLLSSRAGRLGVLDTGAATTPEQAASIERAQERPTSALDLSLEPEIRGEVRTASVEAYRIGMWAGSGIGLLGALIALEGVSRKRADKHGQVSGGDRVSGW